MAEDRWTIRGVSPSLQRAMAERAKAERRTVGELVTEALESLLGTIREDPHESRLTVVLSRLQEVEERLEVLERQDDQGNAEPAADPIAAGRDRSAAAAGPSASGSDLSSAPSLALADLLLLMVEQVETVLGRSDPNVRLARRAAAGDRAAYRELTVGIARLPQSRRTRLAPLVAAVDAAMATVPG